MKPQNILRSLTLLLLSGTSGVQADLAKGLQAAAAQRWEEAYKEFRGPASAGNSNAQVNLGNLYLKGLGVEQSDIRAFDWFEKAALQGNPLGESKLAVLYFYGLGTPPDHRKAAEWFLKAAEQGDVGAARILADLYSNGDGVEKQVAEAYLWASIATELGHPEAKPLRDQLAQELPPAELNAALTRLNQWREQHDRRLDELARENRSASKEIAGSNLEPPVTPPPGKTTRSPASRAKTPALKPLQRPTKTSQDKRSQKQKKAQATK